MKKDLKSLVRLTGKSVFASWIFAVSLIWIVYAASITSTSDTVSSWDSITANWYQEVNDKLGEISWTNWVNTFKWANHDTLWQVNIRTTWVLWDDAQLTFTSSKNWRWIYIDDDDNNKMKFYSWYWKGIVWKEITFDNVGNVGIWTNNPGEKLEVNWNIISNWFLKSWSGLMKWWTIEYTKWSGYQKLFNSGHTAVWTIYAIVTPWSYANWWCSLTSDFKVVYWSASVTYDRQYYWWKVTDVDLRYNNGWYDAEINIASDPDVTVQWFFVWMWTWTFD